MTTRDETWHKKAFTQFVKYELLAGGPDPHMSVASRIARTGEHVCDPAWFCVLYVAVYNDASAEILNHHFPEPRPIGGDEIRALWDRFTLRKERRTAGFGPQRLADHLTYAAEWLSDGGINRAIEAGKAGGFPAAFDVVNEIKFNGRYFTMKLYETLRRTLGGLPPFSDVRPKGGSLSRRALTLMFSEHNPKSDRPADMAEANLLAARIMTGLGKIGLELDWFKTEVMLCDYRQAYAGGQYPGRAHDSELGHLTRLSAKNPLVPFRTLEARDSLFPHWALGEHAGWPDRRKELGKVLTRYDYTWSDSVYDWHRCKNDLEHPVRREVPLT